ncbi:hypothetical protein DXG03_005752 [Asterophora parasitica]|uniref:Heme haloperoxidase family profile domain-containing protein n=1 Tax=Asterophora parasitica TaxID=117018 RepID=A0A9P7K8K3_9AGAR|nr:hypothetical protein DXG03_005752 [Asterophora parasitica]
MDTCKYPFLESVSKVSFTHVLSVALHSPRNGEKIPFLTLLSAVRHVYNLSLPLALLLTTFGYLTSGHFSFAAPLPPPTTHAESEDSDANRSYPSTPSISTALWHGDVKSCIPVLTWTLDLSSLCTRGALKITHDASLVHADSSSPASSSPDPELLAELLSLAHHASSAATSTDHEPDGLTLADLGRLHAARQAALPPGRELNRLHEQVALGECGLAWCVMRGEPRSKNPGKETSEGVIPIAALEQWFGEERLPEGWWDVGGARPERSIGIREAGRRAKEVGMFRGM